MDTEKPTAIESITPESLVEATPQVLNDLMNHLRSIQDVLKDKISIVYKALETAAHKASLAAKVAKMSPEEKTALAQILNGDHIKKESAE